MLISDYVNIQLSRQATLQVRARWNIFLFRTLKWKETRQYQTSFLKCSRQ